MMGQVFNFDGANMALMGQIQEFGGIITWLWWDFYTVLVELRQGLNGFQLLALMWLLHSFDWNYIALMEQWHGFDWTNAKLWGDLPATMLLLQLAYQGHWGIEFFGCCTFANATPHVIVCIVHFQCLYLSVVWLPFLVAGQSGLSIS